MNYPLKVIVFYLFLGFIVFYLSGIERFIGYIVMIAASLLFIWTSGIKLRPGDPLPGSVAGVLAMTAVFAIMLAIGGIAIAGASLDALDVLAYGFVLQAFVAVGEEISFRHYIFEDLDRAAGRMVAVMLSALGFSLMHIHSMLSFGMDPATAVIGLATITMAGILLAVLYIYGGLLSAVGFHFFWNFLQYHVLGLGMQGVMPALIDVAQTGSLLANGGPFGPEASLPGLIVVGITLAAVWWYYHRHNPANETTH